MRSILGVLVLLCGVWADTFILSQESPTRKQIGFIEGNLYPLHPEDFRIGVIEGDIAGQVDAERIAGLGIPTVQLNTDGACHIEAMSIQHILPELPLDQLDVIFVENIGNLVCPAEFNIGESLRITILSVPEGDDKVEKYPLMFTQTGCLALNKYDMLPYFDFDETRVRQNYETLNPGAPFFPVSCRTGEGLDGLCEFLSRKIAESKR